MKRFKGTGGRWEVRHSESKLAFNVVGTRIGSKYKIARCPYVDDKDEARANAQLIAMAPELLETLIEIQKMFDGYDYNENSIWHKANKVIRKALNFKQEINLVIDGIAPEKVMYDTDSHTLIVLYPPDREFKVGDKVKFKKNLNLRLGRSYDGVSYVSSMLPVNNALLTVVKIKADGIVTCSNDMNKDSWDYRPEWLEHITE